MGTLRLPPSETHYFDKCAELTAARAGAAAAGNMWIPRAGNYAAVDVILPGQRPANFTINQEHALLLFAKNNTQGLIPVASAL
ncbi:hypothetical protein OFN56_32295, partial [Escherichia coli]|nr:hypothetical protein [Escherichia coli]